VNYPPSALEPANINSVAEIIGQKLMQLLPERPTLQVGIGAIGDAVALALLNNGKKDISLHTGMLSDAWMRVMQAGLIQEPVVATMMMGSNKLYQYANLNPQTCLYPCDYTHNPLVIAKLPRFCAINFVLEVDLSGQINAETLNGKQISGMGGQADFVTGATLNPEGMVIMALPSTARGGSVSRIVSRLDEGSAITTLRSDVDYVVTEYGVAKLAGKSVAERRKELIKIAHPKFRSELESVS
ncbi:MAG: acetyl-CoA hydrolase/transferase C-terminal domain-containing protein, partial [Desulfotomaculaceae bacterium]